MGVACFSASQNRKLSESKHEKYTDEQLKGSMQVVLEGDKFTYIRREELNYSSKCLKEILEKYYLEKEDLDKLWDFFKKLNEDKTGFITIDDLYILLKEKQSNSMVAPYLDRFFVTIEKRFNDKVAFEEFVTHLISFCLYSIFQVIKFVFDYADKNGMGFITRNDIIALVSVKREDSHIYLQNHELAIRNIAEFSRNDKILLEEFCELCNRMPFVYFPAIKLQKALRKYYINTEFWEKFQKKTIEKHKKNLKYKAEQKIKEKIEGYKKKIEKKNDHKDKDKNNLFMKKVRVGVLARKNSDTNFFLFYKYKKDEEKISTENQISDKLKRVTSSKNINLTCK